MVGAAAVAEIPATIMAVGRNRIAMAAEEVADIAGVAEIAVITTGVTMDARLPPTIGRCLYREMTG